MCKSNFVDYVNSHKDIFGKCMLLEQIHPPHPAFRWVILESYLLPAIFLHTYRRLKCFYYYRLSCHFSSYFITLDYHLTCICFQLSVQLKLQIFLYFLPVLAQDMFQFMSLCSVPWHTPFSIICWIYLSIVSPLCIYTLSYSLVYRIIKQVL